jgi:NADH:ubiquinone oxidoreductase subunit H
MSFSESVLELLKILAPVFSTLFFILCLVVPLLISMAYLTYAERRVIAAMQMRKGPNVVGFFGILQPLADGLKLLLKEPVLPSNANIIIFLLAPSLINKVPNAAVNFTISTGVRLSPVFPPIVPLIPEILLINAIRIVNY